MQRPSSNVHVAIGALVATLFSLGLPVALGLARMLPPALGGIEVTVNGTIITVGLFALPLVWWRHRAGYGCAIAVGVVNVLGNLLAIAQGAPFSDGMPQGTIAVFVAQTVFSALVVLYCVRAWREGTA